MDGSVKKNPFAALPEIAAALLIFFFANLIPSLVLMLSYVMGQSSRLLGDSMSMKEASGIISELLMNDFLPKYTPHITVASAVIGVFVLLLVAKKIDSPVKTNLGFIKPDFKYLGCIVALAAGLQVFITLAVDSILVLPGMEEAAKQMELSSAALDGPDVIFSLIAVSLFAPVNEEIFFRGFILRSMEKHGWNKTVAVVVQALLFGAFHVISVQVAYAFVIGLILGVLRLKFNSIWPCIILHVSFNCFVCWTSLVPAPQTGEKVFLFAVSGLIIFSSLRLLLGGRKTQNEA